MKNVLIFVVGAIVGGLALTHPQVKEFGAKMISYLNKK